MNGQLGKTPTLCPLLPNLRRTEACLFLQIRFLPTAWRATWFLRCGQPVRTVDCWQCADDYYSRSMRRQIQCRFPGRATSRTNRATSTTSKNRRSPENKELSQNTSSSSTTQHNTHTHRRPVCTAGTGFKTRRVVSTLLALLQRSTDHCTRSSAKQTADVT